MTRQEWERVCWGSVRPRPAPGLSIEARAIESAITQLGCDVETARSIAARLDMLVGPGRNRSAKMTGALLGCATYARHAKGDKP